MQCIWEGSLRNVLDNIKLCVIIENLHFWAMNHLRPWLSSCIDQWKRSIDEFESENNRYKPERSSEKQSVKPNQSKARVPVFGANQSKPRSPLVDENTSNHVRTRNPSEGLASRVADLLEPCQKLRDPNYSKARSSSGGRTVLRRRSRQLDTHGRSNFALRRANTLESFLDQDEGHASSDDTSERSEEEEEEDGEEEESEEEQDDYDHDHEPGTEEEEDEEREENMDIALEQLKISLRHDRRGRNALHVLLGYWSQYED